MTCRSSPALPPRDRFQQPDHPGGHPAAHRAAGARRLLRGPTGASCCSPPTALPSTSARSMGRTSRTGPAAPGAPLPTARSPSIPSLAGSSTARASRRRSRCRSTTCYGFPAAIGGGPYDRSAALSQLDPKHADYLAIVGSFPDLAHADPSPDLSDTLEHAVAGSEPATRWNQQRPGSTGIIVLPGFESLTADLTGPAAVQLPAGSSLAIVVGQTVPAGRPSEVKWKPRGSRSPATSRSRAWPARPVRRAPPARRAAPDQRYLDGRPATRLRRRPGRDPGRRLDLRARARAAPGRRAALARRPQHPGHRHRGQSCPWTG